MPDLKKKGKRIFKNELRTHKADRHHQILFWRTTGVTIDSGSKCVSKVCIITFTIISSSSLLRRNQCGRLWVRSYRPSMLMSRIIKDTETWIENRKNCLVAWKHCKAQASKIVSEWHSMVTNLKLIRSAALNK